MRHFCITLGFKSREEDAVPEIISGPEVPYAVQEEALDAAARADDGGGFVRQEIWCRQGAGRTVEFSTAEEKARAAAALNTAAEEAAAAARAKSARREELLKEAQALGFDPAAAEAEAARAKADADAARAEAEAVRAELEALKASAGNTSSQETAPGADEIHNLEEAGSTPAPATNSPATVGGDGAESVAASDSVPSPSSATTVPPVSGKKGK